MGCGCGKKKIERTSVATVAADGSTNNARPAGPLKDRVKPEEVVRPMDMGNNRKSCIQCVEKHIGAAIVLSTELQQGYPYRVRIIGHLHEAEEESLQWPELSAAIREERVKFQQSGGKVLPDFDRIINIMGKYADNG